MTEKWTAQPFTRLRGTVKGLFDEAVGACTLYVGENQSGKTGRLIAVRYACAGVHGYSAGAHGSDIARLAPEGCEQFFCALDGPSGTAQFGIERVNGKWKEPANKGASFTGELAAHMTEEVRSRVLPLVSMSDLLELGPDRGRRALMERFGEADRVPAPLAMTDEQTVLWTEVLAEQTALLTKQGVAPSPSDTLVAVNKALAKRKRDKGAQISALEKALAEQEKALTEQAAGSEQLPTLRAQLEQARVWENTAHLRLRAEQIEVDKIAYREKAATITAALNTAPSAVDTPSQAATAEEGAAAATQTGVLEEATAAAQTALDLARAATADLQTRAGTGQVMVNYFKGQIAHVDEQGQAPCMLCTNPVNPQEMLDRLAPLITERLQSITTAFEAIAEHERAVQTAKDRLQQHEAHLAQLARDAAEQKAQADRTAAAQKAQSDRTVAELTQEHSRILAQDSEVQGALKSAQAITDYIGPTVEALQAQIEALETAASAREHLEEQTAELRTRKQARELAKELEGESKILLQGLIKQVKDVAEAAINYYMPQGQRAQVDLDKNQWQVLDQRGNPRDRRAMCGFEECSLVPALALGYTEGAPLRILTLDDRDLAGFSFENAVRFFAALQAAVAQGLLTQVFAAGSRLDPILDRLRECGWTIIRTDQPAATVTPIAAAPLAVPPVPPGNGAPSGNGVPRL